MKGGRIYASTSKSFSGGERIGFTLSCVHFSLVFFCREFGGTKTPNV